MQEESSNGVEPNMRLNIKQSAKGDKYWDITTRGNTIEEIKERIQKLKELAIKVCE